MKTQNEYPPVVQQIHNEFNIAGDRLLEESLAILEKAEKVDIDKAQRLNSVGFANNPLLLKALDVEQITRNPALMAKVVMQYKQKYPLHKFISTADVNKICAKYKLVKGTTEQYIGFVPEKNLSEIEYFKKQFNVKRRLYVNSITFSYRHQSNLHKAMLDKLKSSRYLLLDESMKNFTTSYDFKTNMEHRFLMDYVAISKIKTTDMPEFDICAPKKDMISNERYAALKGLFEIKVSVVPDPVVLFPVEHGYIIVTAWGDEASDPLVANENMN